MLQSSPSLDKQFKQYIVMQSGGGKVSSVDERLDLSVPADIKSILLMSEMLSAHIYW